VIEMKKTIVGVAAAMLLSSGVMAATGAQAKGISEFSASITSLRDTCAKQAKDVSNADALAQYQSAIDRKTALNQAQIDAQVYGASGNGSRETRDYAIERMQEASQGSDAKDAKIADKVKTDTAAVLACVANAEGQGKALYSDFKKHHKRDASAAESLMTAWLTNVDEISFSAPNGSDATNSAWNTAKTHAELAAL
jgi:hypothetical protein